MYENTALTCVMPKYSTYLSDTKIQHLPVRYQNTALTCVIPEHSTYLCDIKIQHWPVWYQNTAFTCMKIQQLPAWYQTTAITYVISSDSTYLCDIKLQHLPVRYQSAVFSSCRWADRWACCRIPSCWRSELLTRPIPLVTWQYDATEWGYAEIGGWRGGGGSRVWEI